MGNLSGVDAIFRIALSIESGEIREEYLRQACGENQVLHDRVAALLCVQNKRPDFLEPPPGAMVATIDFPPIAERPGTQIGPYKLIEEIGEGGMGVVYMAAQKEPVRRKVALKIIKPGMDTREVIARFAAEEQALALMDHPNIAKVFDAGTTESGRPYFVMELVNGVPLTQYCDDNNATTAQRLELFVLLCHAVQHAHQKGIIHRDIKPRNILVTMHDGIPVPKIIDFGIAKAINQQLTANTVYTSHGQMIGTPLYMSPEQAEHSGLDIDTRSDIYSLGVLLYELLTGSTPFDGEQLKDAGYDEVRRLIREQEPPRPSTRISTLGKAATTASEHRRTNPVALSNSLRHELDWIVMKALDKDRTRRYQTANDFARDIQRYLDDEPVEACPPSTAYRLKKFTRRHRTGVLAVTAVGLALILGAGVAAGQAYRATKAEWVVAKQLEEAKEASARERQLRAEADTALHRAEVAADYLVEAFRSPDPAKDGRTITVAELLGRAAQDLRAKFDTEPGLKAQLLGALGKTYCGLGLPHEAIPLLEQCRDIRSKTLGIEDPESLKSLTALVDAYWQAGRDNEAAKLAAVARDLYLKVYGALHFDTLRFSTSDICVLVRGGRCDEAIRRGEEVLHVARGTLGPEHATTLEIMNNLGLAYCLTGQFGKAIKLLEDSLAASRKTRGVENPETLITMYNLGDTYCRAGRYKEAMPVLDEALPLLQKVLGPEHPLTLLCMESTGLARSGEGQFAGAITILEEAWQKTGRTVGPADAKTLAVMTNLAMAHLEAGHFRPAMELSEKGVEMSHNYLQPRDRMAMSASSKLARVLLATGNYDAAVKLFDEAAQLQRETLGPLDCDTLTTESRRPLAYSELGRHDDAIQLGEKALHDTQQTLGGGHPITVKSIVGLATVYSAAGRCEEAVALIEMALPVIRGQWGPEHDTTLNAMHALAIAYHSQGRLEEALALHQHTLQLRQKGLGADHPRTLASMILLGSAYIEQARYADAEPLLLAAQEGYAKRDVAYPTPYDHAQTRESCSQLVQLYEKSNQPDKAAAWKEKLAALTAETKQVEGNK